ncbi:MAG TPA: hypothetical protein EYP57_06270 [Thermodesulfobacteriaceae bacterium]|nr:hypothetical protein [Thermodesulfobacteriaceae bacterium]
MRICLLLFLSAFILLLFQGDSLWGRSLIENELKTQQKRLKSLQEEIAIHREHASDIEKSRESVLQELETLNRDIQTQWQRLQDTKQQWTIKELELLEAARNCSRQKTDLQRLQVQVERRLRALSRFGAVGSFNVLFAAETIPELISRETYLKTILDQDRKQRHIYQTRLRLLSEKKIQLEHQRKELQEAAVQIKAEAELLEERKQQRRSFLEELRLQSELYDEMLAELRSAEQSLHEIIHKLNQERQKELSYSGHLALTDSFLAQKGKLNPPVSGSISRPKRGNSQYGLKGPGIVIAAHWGSEIRSVFDGTVVFNDPLRGFGNVLIINHGDQYYTLMAQGMKFFKKVGQKVVQGEIVGLVGGGPWIDGGIYFEIRNRDRQEDPLEWLDLRGVRLRN